MEKNVDKIIETKKTERTRDRKFAEWFGSCK